MSIATYQVKKVETEAEARIVASFLTSDEAFDDPRMTPGETAQFQTNPYQAVNGDYKCYFMRNEAGEVIGVNTFMENEQQTGGYYWDYLVVHKAYRKRGVASLLQEAMMGYLQSVRARYIITYTCSLDCYRPIRDIFERLGFAMIGKCPDYYFEGEDRLIYYRKLAWDDDLRTGVHP